MKRIFKWSAAAVVALGILLVSHSSAFAQEVTMEEALRGINTVWLLVAAFLVFFMQAGFALVESGSTRSKNAVNVLMKNLIDFVFATIAFWATGYALMFGAGTPWVGLNNFFVTGSEEPFIEGIPTLAFWFFQLVFAGTAATIVSGAMAERTKFSAYIVYSIVITAVIYPIFGHWTWGGGWLSQMGFVDFAGSTVVHSIGGWAALMGAIALGPRIGRYDKDGKPVSIPGHSMALVALGVFVLWLGWFGFNPGSQILAHGTNADAIALIAANTNIAAAAGALGAMIVAWIWRGKPDAGFTFNGVLGGLVAITASCAFVTTGASVIIGLVGGVVIVAGTALLEKIKVDDPVGAVPVHLMAGIWGTLAVGLFPFDMEKLTAQAIGVGACALWAGGTSYILFMVVKATMGLRVSAEEEEQGLDFFEHGTVAYPDINVLPEPALATVPASPAVVPAAKPDMASEV